MKTTDQVYLEKLLKSLQSLLKQLNKGKPGSAYSEAEIRALSHVNLEAPKGLSSFVRTLNNQLQLIHTLPQTKRTSAIYFLQQLLSSVQRLSAVLKIIEIQKLNRVQKELTANNVMDMDRKKLAPMRDNVFEDMIVQFLKAGDKFNDHIYMNIAMLPGLYLLILEYYLKHKKNISGTRQWYDFLVISNYMLNGIKLELLLLERLKKR